MFVVTMPGDGLSRRNGLAEQGRQHILIIALTAHAMKVDKERCLESGMDGYVSKRLNPYELFALTDRVVAAKKEGATGGNGKVFNKTEVLERLDGDVELFVEMAKLLVDDSFRLMDTIMTAINAGDAPGVRLYAHSLKGAVSNFGAPTVAQLALNLEMAGASGDLRDAISMYSSLDKEMGGLRAALLAEIGAPTA